MKRRGATFDRVGGVRVTELGTLTIMGMLVVLLSPPAAADDGVVAVMAGAAMGIVVLGAVVPYVLVRRVTVSAASPRDATVGDTVLIDVDFGGRLSRFEARVLDPTGPWRQAGAPGSGQLSHLADRRGLFGAIRIEVRVTAPLGIAAAHRVHAIELPHAVEVAPRPLAVSWVPAAAPVSGGPHPVARPAMAGDLVRSVRPYVAGDPAHLVHWPSSARTGALVVRELEPPQPVGLAIVVDLTGQSDEIERVASYGLGGARAVLAAGGELVLCTREAGGPVTGRVTNLLDAGRRLARAVPGPPGEPPPGWPVVEIGQ